MYLKRRDFIKSSFACVVALSFPKQSNALPLPYANYLEGDYFCTLNRIGQYKNNVVQSFVIDLQNNLILTQHVGGKEQQSYLCCYHYTKSDPLVANSQMQLKEICGHQGLSIQQTLPNLTLWSSAGKKVQNSGLHGIRFHYIENSELTDFEVFKFFDEDNFKSRGSTMPTVSVDKKYLIVRGYAKDGKSIIRVFDIKTLNETNDLSNHYISEWEVLPISKDKNYPIQGITSDGKYVFIQLGFYSVEKDKALLIYTLNGKLVYQKEQYKIGKNDAQKTGKGEHWEPEGICFSKDKDGINQLFHCIVSGDVGRRIVRIYGKSIS